MQKNIQSHIFSRIYFRNVLGEHRFAQKRNICISNNAVLSYSPGSNFLLNHLQNYNAAAYLTKRNNLCALKEEWYEFEIFILILNLII